MPIITHEIDKEKRKKHTPKGEKRVSTGIKEYDMLIGGGFFNRSVNLISGCSGSGKTLFCMTFLYEGAKNGLSGAYITIE